MLLSLDIQHINELSIIAIIKISFTFSSNSQFFLGGKAATGFVERCISYIGENATNCFKTNSFLSLSKDAVIKLISSDYVSTLDASD